MSPKGNENSGSIIDLLYIYYMYKSEGRLKPKSGILEIPWLNLGLYIYIYRMKVQPSFFYQNTNEIKKAIIEANDAIALVRAKPKMA